MIHCPGEVKVHSKEVEKHDGAETNRRELGRNKEYLEQRYV